jgi:peptide chain release factor 1
MLDKLEGVLKRYRELEEMLSDPGVVGDRDRYRKITKEKAAMEERVAAATEYRSLMGEIDGAREIVDGGDDQELREMAREELKGLQAKREALEEKLRLLLIPRDPNDDRNVILEIRGGAGGDEAALFATELFRMYSRYAESRGWRVEVMSQNATGIGGLKEVIALIEGNGAYSRLKFESGVHRVQRVPVTEAGGRIHTSTVTVAVLPEAEDVDVAISADEIRVDVFRSSGPGGQSVNTTDSAVRITHLPTGLVVSCQDEKSQHKNKAKALKILRSRLLDLAQAEQQDRIAAERKSMVGTGDRSERIRTYNFPQNRVTDHRIGLTLHRLEAVLAGEIDPFVDALLAQHQAGILAALSSADA